jgi:hypothetical protein
MDRRKVLIVVVVLIVVLFVVGIGVGAGSDGNQKIDSNALNADWLKSLQDGLAKPQPMASQDVSLAAPADCVQADAFVVPPGGTCLVLIKRSSNPATRRLTLNLSEGATAELTLQQKSAVTLKANLTDATPRGNWDVYQDGGTLTLLCQDSGPAPACRLVIEK